MKYAVFSAVGLALAATTFTTPANAGPFDKIRSKVKKVEKKAKEVEQTAEDAKDVVDTVRGKKSIRTRTRSSSRYPKTATGPGHAGRAGPAPAKYTGLTKCAGIPIKNAFIGQMGEYSWSNGLNTETGTGLLNREKVTASNGCIMPSMGTYDTLYIEVPTAQLNSVKGGWKMQCVDQKTGKMANSEAFPRWYNTRGKDVMLHTGNSAGYEPSFTGSISDRSAAWDKDLKRRGMTMFGFNMPPLHNDSGTDFYCQYYNAESGKSVVAFAYRRSAG